MDDKNDDKIDESVCKLCDVVFLSDRMRKDHLHGKRHLMAMHNVFAAKTKEELGIYIRGLYDFSQQEILDLFGKYGTVSSSYFADNNRFCIMQFDNRETVEKLIKMEKIVYKQKHIIISRRNVKEREVAKVAYSDSTENLEEINKGLRNLPTFNVQLTWLIDHIQPRHEVTRSKVFALCNDLESVLNEEFGKCEIHVFGSTVTNLYMNNSDIDIYVFVYNAGRATFSTPSTNVSRAKLRLSKYGRVFTNLVAIPHAKTPIVKFLHVPTNMKCDFNFKNMLGVCNSRLIYYYLSLDFKLTPLMIFLKHWAKSHDLIGLGGKFSNYGVALMFIFYMQQDLYRFPPVRVLQTVNCINMQDGWNGGFNRIPTFSKNLQTQDMITVLLGFFEYYATFNYTFHVICPYLGTVVLKNDLLNPKYLSDIFYLYNSNHIAGKPLIRVDNPICIQDPFELNHNVAGGVNVDYLKEFTTYCSIAVNILKDIPQIRNAMYRLLVEEPETFERKCVVNEKECKFQIPLAATLLQVNEILKFKNVSKGDEETETVRIWRDELKAVTLNILEDIMRFTVQAIKEPNEKSQRRLDQKDIHDLLYSSFRCYGFYNMWDGHKVIKKDLDVDKSKSLFEQQLEITKYIFEKLYKSTTLTERIIQFDLKIEFTKVSGEAVFNLKNSGSKADYFKKFSLYFLKMLPLVFQGHLIERLKLLKNDSVIVLDD